MSWCLSCYDWIFLANCCHLPGLFFTIGSKKIYVYDIFRDPNPLLEDGGIKWSRFTEDERKYLRLVPPLDSSCSRDHFKAKKMALWNDYLPYLQQNTPCSHQRSKCLFLGKKFFFFNLFDFFHFRYASVHVFPLERFQKSHTNIRKIFSRQISIHNILIYAR